MLHLVKFFIEDLADTFSHSRLKPFSLLHDYVGVHHDQASVGIPDKTRIFGFSYHAGDSGRGEPDIEDRIHHSGHGRTGAGATRDQKRIDGIAVFLIHNNFDLLHPDENLFGQFIGKFTPVSIISSTALGANGETCWHGNTQ